MRRAGRLILGLFLLIAGLYLLENYLIQFFKIIFGIIFIFTGLGFLLGGKNAKFYTKIYK